MGGAILLAIVGNALWEFLVRPSLLASQDFLLNLSTLGIQAFKDSMYVDIAKGRYDRASVELLGQYMALVGGCAFFAISMLFMTTKRLRGQLNKLKEKVQSMDHADSVEKIVTKEGLLASMADDEKKLRKLDRLAYFLAFVVGTMVLANLTAGLRIKYMNAAVTNFEQTLSITKPYLTVPRKEELLRSTFSQIRNKDGYVQLIEELRGIAEKNGQHVPEFKIW